MLRSSETETQGWIQFETSEYLIDRKLRDKILQLMVAQGRNKACGFVGPLDVILRQGEIPEVNDAINDFFREATKLGIEPENAAALLDYTRTLKHVSVEGLMGMAPFNPNPEMSRASFQRLRKLCNELGLSVLSMGMSGDFEVAIEEGATMVRLGRIVWGGFPT